MSLEDRQRYVASLPLSQVLDSLEAWLCMRQWPASRDDLRDVVDEWIRVYRGEIIRRCDEASLVGRER